MGVNLPTMGFATKVMGGNTNNKKDSRGKRLGLKKWGHSAEIFPNDILVRQRGFKWHPGHNVSSGRDHTLHSNIEVTSYYKLILVYRVRSHGQKIGMLTLDRCVFTSSLWSNPIDVSQILLPLLTTLSYSLIWVRQTPSQQITLLIKRLTPRKWSKFVLQLSRSPLTSN